VKVELDEYNQIVSIADNKCPRGKTYAEQEVVNPVRVLTTTVRIESNDSEHPLLPVQTRDAIPKGILKDAMKELADVVVKSPVKYKDIIVQDILGTGVDVIATFEILE
jgi:CxxC motif-containing protein